jgi:hypothetical protein
VSTIKLIAVVLVVMLGAMLVQPAPAEAIEPLTIITIAGAAVLVLTVIVVVIIANVREGQRDASVDAPMLVAFDAGAVQGQ